MLAQNLQRLREKIRIFALLELIRENLATFRVFEYGKIAEATNLPSSEVLFWSFFLISEVEFLLMKSLSLDVVRGKIDSIDEVFLVEWVRPRALDREDLSRVRGRIDTWIQKVHSTATFLHNETPELVA